MVTILLKFVSEEPKVQIIWKLIVLIYWFVFVIIKYIFTSTYCILLIVIYNSRTQKPNPVYFNSTLMYSLELKKDTLQAEQNKKKINKKKEKESLMLQIVEGDLCGWIPQGFWKKKIHTEIWQCDVGVRFQTVTSYITQHLTQELCSLLSSLLNCQLDELCAE